jgi:hypothetical protein
MDVFWELQDACTHTSSGIVPFGSICSDGPQNDGLVAPAVLMERCNRFLTSYNGNLVNFYPDPRFLRFTEYVRLDYSNSTAHHYIP